ncbi:hypothetical protein EDB89DRAFT_2067696 [Lactarius sanguifluus]|nr:hypothetical protein EDB89DRAFT_2067696 [Lactarius sanguifluus]
MLPFILAFIIAIGIPFLPSSLHRALYLPRFNFLSATYAPERAFVPSSERPLLLDNNYSRDGSDSCESSQYLVFSTPNYEADSDVLAYMSFTEKLGLNYPQTSIWLIICAQLLYQLVEAMVVMALSFLFAATFLSRRSLSTLIERFCTALFICWHYTPKAALSTFLQDVLLCVHKYWMDNSVTSDPAPTTAANISQRVPLKVLADSILSTSEGLNLVASKEVNFWSENSSSVALITPPRSRETSAPPEPALVPLGQPVYPLSASKEDTRFNPTLPAHGPSTDACSRSPGSATELSKHKRSSDVLKTPVERHLFHPTASSIVTRAAKSSNYTGTSPPNSDLSGADEVAASLSHGSTPSFVTISMRDLYNAKKSASTPIPLSAPPAEDHETKPPDAISGPSLDHGSITNVNSTTSNPETDESQADDFRSSSSERSYSGRRRYKSDGIQVRSARCHLGDSAAPPDPAKVDGTCAFWKSAMQRDEKGGGDFEKQVLAPGFLPGSSSLERPEPHRVVTAGSVGSADVALAGMVLTPGGKMMVPASQRADGSMRKEIKVRPGHFLREPLSEKYRPPAARVRTTTWEPRLREYLATPPSSPHTPFMPKSVHQRFFGRQCDSPASLTNNWRRSNWSLTAVETSLAKGNDPFTPPPPPPPVEKVSSSPTESTYELNDFNTSPKLPAPKFFTPSQTETIVPPMSTQALASVDNQSSLVPQGDQLLSRPSELEFAERVTGPVPDDSTEQTESRKPARAIGDTVNFAAPFKMEEESRFPLRDITTSLPVLVAVDRPNPPSTPTVLASMTALQVANVIQRDLEAPSRTPVMESRETPLPSPYRKRKPSGEPNTQCAVKSAVLSPSESPTPAPHRRPRTRRSAPHLGKSASNKRQVKTQTPEGSAKRRRMRTASALGVENVVAATVDRNGQIVLPAGTGWKGRSMTASQLPVPQRQRQQTLPSGATTHA